MISRKNIVLLLSIIIISFSTLFSQAGNQTNIVKN